MERGHTHRQKRHQPDHDIHKSVATVGTSLQIKGNPTLARHATHPSVAMRLWGRAERTPGLGMKL